ncbi:hypothetical protein [Microbacterium paludicola]|uniref:hypothetical protein n=1 Tax=Microbacterium paludicola TaxID=300019 RepID=UPI00119E1C36|nr:hypothetical protein [Microbacterium paludicola]
MKKTSVRLLAAGLSLLAVGLATGCSAVDRIAYQRETLHFDDRSGFVAGFDAAAAWLPSDGQDISVVHSTQANDALVSVQSDATLDPDLCTSVPRQSAPDYSFEGMPDVYKRDTVFACGEWSVIASDIGWIGWTPNHPEEQAASPR